MISGLRAIVFSLAVGLGTAASAWTSVFGAHRWTDPSVRRLPRPRHRTAPRLLIFSDRRRRRDGARATHGPSPRARPLALRKARPRFPSPAMGRGGSGPGKFDVLYAKTLVNRARLEERESDLSAVPKSLAGLKVECFCCILGAIQQEPRHLVRALVFV